MGNKEKKFYLEKPRKSIDKLISDFSQPTILNESRPESITSAVVNLKKKREVPSYTHNTHN